MTPLTRLSDIDLKLLRIFQTVVACGGFSPAEAELNISRPAISQHMAELEARLGLTLCQRGRAGFRLTDEGEAVHAALTRLFAALENFRGEVNAVRAELRGELNIGITDNLVTSPRMIVTKALRALKTKGPAVRVNIRMIPPAQIERGVLEGQLHVGVTQTGRTLPGLRGLTLYDETSHLYCSTDHPFHAQPDAGLTADQIARADAVAPSTPTPPAGLNVTATAADREGVAFLILTGCYIGFLPTHYARQWVERGQMRALQPETYSQCVEYQAVTRKSGHPNLVLSTFLGLLSPEA
jgi:DNA-binding transcriptional LysR family regulator